jgi:lactoylglutathione lyase
VKFSPPIQQPVDIMRKASPGELLEGLEVAGRPGRPRRWSERVKRTVVPRRRCGRLARLRYGSCSGRWHGTSASFYAVPDMARAIGINHVALEVGSVDEALAWYGRFFDLVLRGRSGQMAFVDLGDQFLALAEGRRQPADDGRHFGLVVDDKEGLRAALAAAGVPVARRGSLRFQDPWGNSVEIVGYGDVQFTKAPEVLGGMGLDGLEKSAAAREELRAKGLA